MIIFTHMKTTASTKHWLIGLWFLSLNYLNMACAPQNGIVGAVLTGTAEVTLDESCFPKILVDSSLKPDSSNEQLF